MVAVILVKGGGTTFFGRVGFWVVSPRVTASASAASSRFNLARIDGLVLAVIKLVPPS